MDLSQGVIAGIAVGAAGVALLSLIMNFVLGRRLARMRRERRTIRLPDPSLSIDTPEGLTRELAGLAAEVAGLQDAVAHSVQRVGLIRFDAFEDMGGHLSFAAALLDARGDGIVLSSINGRSETRMYAKPVEGGSSRHNLSAEEEEAIRRALGVLRR